MARPATIHLRKLRKSEHELLRKKLRDKTVSARIYERYRVIESAQQGYSVPEIFDRSGMHVTSIYDWIARFNEHGLKGFDGPSNPGGRPSALTGNQLREMVKIVLSRPTDPGFPYTRWSVEKLRRFLIERGLFPDFSSEWVRRLLRREGIILQAPLPPKDLNLKNFAALSLQCEIAWEVTDQLAFSLTPAFTRFPRIEVAAKIRGSSSTLSVAYSFNF